MIIVKIYFKTKLKFSSDLFKDDHGFNTIIFNCVKKTKDYAAKKYEDYRKHNRKIPLKDFILGKPVEITKAHL